VAGLKQINALPNTFRFPEWQDDVFYAADSIVAYGAYQSQVDSDTGIDLIVTELYFALRNVVPYSGVPTSNATIWASFKLNEIAVTNDIDPHFGRLDSDTLVLRNFDSDLLINIDSDTLQVSHDRRAGDSDIKVMIANTDSDLLQLRHDLNANDSDSNATVLALPSWNYGAF